MLINEDFNDIIKLLIVGDFSVGKTNFILQFVENQFCESPPITASCDIKTKIIHVKDKQIKIQLWDTCGQEKYLSVTTSLFSKADGIIVIYDVTNYSSFSNLTQWIELIKETCGKVHIMIVGNKIDLTERRCVSEEMGIKFANANHFKYKEVSAKNNFGIKETINELLEVLLETTETSFMGLSLNNSVNSERKSCCKEK